MGKANLFLITAPSGAGKTSIAQEIEKQGEWMECISHTTRKMRDGEVDGKTYHFVTEEDFGKMLKNGEFAEYVTYNGNHYGMSKAEIERVLSTGRDAFIIVEHEGYKQIKKLYPDAIGIFLYMDKRDCLINMLLRGDTIEGALERIELYDNEMKDIIDYDYLVKNVRGKQTETLDIIKSIVKQYRKSQLYIDDKPPILTQRVASVGMPSVKVIPYWAT